MESHGLGKTHPPESKALICINLLDQRNLVDRAFELELSIPRIGDIWIQINLLEFTSHSSFLILGVERLFGEGDHIFCVEMEGHESKFMC
jgi:hypothetical protein